MRSILKILFVLFFLFIELYAIPYTLYPTLAAPSPLPLGSAFGFGHGAGEIKDLGQGTTRLVQPTFALATVSVVVYFLVAAFKYLKAGNNKEDVEGAKQMITHSIIGFVVLMFAFLILQFLIARLFGIENFKLIG